MAPHYLALGPGGGLRHDFNMPTLDWIGKKAVLNHHRKVPYRWLHCDAKLSAGDPDSGPEVQGRLSRVFGAEAEAIEKTEPQRWT